jgi:hypothetical protein
MGQYYKAVILKPNYKDQESIIMATISPYDFGNMAKIMEHAFVENHYVMAALRMIDLYDTEKTGVPFVWCGDYADRIDTSHHRITKKDDSGIDVYDEADVFIYGNSDDSKTPEYNELCDRVSDFQNFKYKYAINHTKKQYVEFPDEEPDKWIIHPLPILCSFGNGRGGGDYCTDVTIDGKLKTKPNAKYVGKWAFDNISVAESVEGLEGYKRCRWNIEYED